MARISFDTIHNIYQDNLIAILPNSQVTDEFRNITPGFNNEVYKFLCKGQLR